MIEIAISGEEAVSSAASSKKIKSYLNPNVNQHISTYQHGVTERIEPVVHLPGELICVEDTFASGKS